MKTLRLPLQKTSLSTRIATLRNDIKARLKKFCIDKVIEHKLAPRTFSFEFDLDGTRDGGQKKSVQRMQALLYKNLLKRIPYLVHAKRGEFLKYENSNRLGIVLQLPTPIPVKINANSDVQIAFEQSPKILAFKKYFKRINRHLREQGQCLKLESSFEYHVPKGESMKYANAREQQSHQVIMFSGMVYVHFYIGVWYHRAYMDRRQNSAARSLGIKSQKEYVDAVLAGKLENSTNIVTSSDAWRFQTFREIYSVKDCLGYYLSTEKLFLILDEMQTVLKTLSRNTTYDPSAFNIGSPEAS
ncbi:hypothetical protein D3C87_459860 [compost metagenome]